MLPVFRLLLISTLLALSWMVPRPGTAQERSSSEGVVVERGDKSGVMKVTLPTSNGRVAWEDISRAMVRVARLDDQVLSHLPHGDFKVTGVRAGLTLATVNQLLGPEIRLAVVHKTNAASPVVEITIDRDRLRKKSQQVREEIRQFTADSKASKLVLDEPTEAATGPLVVLVHGFSATPSNLQVLHSELTNAKHRCGTFSYPNDGPISESAILLSRELKELQRKHSQPVVLVTHSMGGLVARAVIEDPELDPGNVRRLIMIAPPNGGSHWAYCPVGTDAWDIVVTRHDKPLDDLIVNSLTDGWNEARRDMRPDSRFLRNLNARDRNRSVEYTVILGTGAAARSDDVAKLRKMVARVRSENRIGRLVGPRLDEYFSDLDDITEGTGDGVVAVKRGRLAGVEDVVLLPFRHTAVLQDFDDPANKQVLEVVLNRLGRG